MSKSTTFPCPRCGAPLPVEPTAKVTTCAYCHATSPVAPALREQAIANAGRVEAVRGRADAAVQAIGMYGVAARYAKDWWKPAVAIGGVMLTTSVAGMLLGPRFAESVLSYLAPVLVYGTMGYFALRYYRAYRRAMHPAQTPIAVAGSTCERCGGPLVFEAGNARAVCRACLAVAVAGRTLQENLAAAAEQQARKLDLERARAERQMYRGAFATQGFVQVYAAAVFSLPFVLLALVGLGRGTASLMVGLAHGRSAEVSHGLWMIALGAGATLALGAGAELVARRMVRPARARRLVLDALAARLGGHVVEGGTSAALDWLDACWPGPAPHELMIIQQDFRRATLTTAVEGLPALVVVVTRAPGPLRVNELHVLVAKPRLHDARAPLPDAAKPLQQLGFDVKVSEDGVALTRASADVEVFNEATLSWVLAAAAGLARA